MQQYADIYLLQSHSTFFGCHSTWPDRDWFVQLAQTSPDQAMMEGSSCTSIMTCTGGAVTVFNTPDDDAVTPETSGVTLQ